MKTIENRDGWSEQRVARLKSLWADGLSCSAIARDLGGITRNAVIGKVCRLGLPHRKISDNSHKRPYPKQRRSPATFNFGTTKAKANGPSIAPEPYVSRETVVTPPEKRIPFEALEISHCRYPHGETPPYAFCGAKSILGTSWCPTHFHVVTGAPHPSQLSNDIGQFEPVKVLEAVE